MTNISEICLNVTWLLNILPYMSDHAYVPSSKNEIQTCVRTLHACGQLTFMLLKTNLANKEWSKKKLKNDWKPGAWVLICMRVLSESYPMNTNVTGCVCFSKAFLFLSLGSSSLSIGRVEDSPETHTCVWWNLHNSGLWWIKGSQLSKHELEMVSFFMHLSRVLASRVSFGLPGSWKIPEFK